MKVTIKTQFESSDREVIIYKKEDRCILVTKSCKHIPFKSLSDAMTYASRELSAISFKKVYLLDVENCGFLCLPDKTLINSIAKQIMSMKGLAEWNERIKPTL